LVIGASNIGLSLYLRITVLPSRSAPGTSSYVARCETAFWALIEEDITLKMYSKLQKEVCEKWGASYLACADQLKVGISKNFEADNFPINGLRHPPESGTSGWYIWSGEECSAETDFFVAVHAIHLNQRCPEVVKYLGLGPGWRFLFAPGYVDVWFDRNLLNT
jgi:hypothetical protein